MFWRMPDTVSRHKSFYKVFSPLADIRAQIHKNYVEPVEDDKLLTGAIRGMLKQLDPFSEYIPMDQLEAFDQRTTGVVHGIGVFLGERNSVLTVISPLEDSPAFKAGIMPGDQILRIDGVLTDAMTLPEAASRISGECGTTVTLKVRHELTETVEQLTVRRDTVRIHSVKGYVRHDNGHWDYMIDKDNDIAYVRITDFQRGPGNAGTAEELDKAFRQMRNRSLKGLVIDLRFNPGGLLQSAVDVANRFLDEGVIVSTKGRYAQEVTWPATPEDTYKPDVPLVVLVNQYTASAAEILAGALRDHQRATIIGVRTFGKGSVQTLRPLAKSYGAIKLTTAHYYLPSGRNIHRNRRYDPTPDANASSQPSETTATWGVDPNIRVVLTDEEIIAIRRSRRDTDALFAPSTRQNERNGTARCTQPKAMIIDRQLARALDVLRPTSAATSKPTGQTVRPGSAKK